MSIVLPAVGIAFAAFCVWLTVRIVNRRERWAKWTAVVLLIVVLAGYPLSIGPVCWLRENMLPESISSPIMRAYMPLVWIRDNAPAPVRDTYWTYLGLWVEVDPY